MPQTSMYPSLSKCRLTFGPCMFLVASMVLFAGCGNSLKKIKERKARLALAEQEVTSAARKLGEFIKAQQVKINRLEAALKSAESEQEAAETTRKLKEEKDLLEGITDGLKGKLQRQWEEAVKYGTKLKKPEIIDRINERPVARP